MKILVVDDHPVMLEGLSALLRHEGPETVIVQASNAAEALAAVEGHDDLDVVVLDLMMPETGGLSTIPEIGRMRPELPVIVLSSSENPSDVRNALSLGALGYVPKSASQTTLLSAIWLVMSGELYIPPLLLSRAEAAKSFTGRSTIRALLTPRQIDVLRYISESMPNKTNAYEMALSEKTVKARITAIVKALNVVNRTQAVAAGRHLDPGAASDDHGAGADEATMTTIGVIRTAGMVAVVSLCVASCKPQLTCRLVSGGDWFPVTAYSEVSGAAAAQPGSLACDVVYRIDGQVYVIGGCNRSPVGLWPKGDVSQVEEKGAVGRRALLCKP